MFNPMNNEQEEKQEQIYRIEMDHLRKKTVILNILMLIMAPPIIIALYMFDINPINLVVYSLVFVFLIAINSMFFHYKHLFPDIRLSMYITTFGLYLITIAAIVDIATPSVFTMLFLTYALVSIYQDFKLALTNNLLLLFSGSLIVLQFHQIFQTSQALSLSSFYIMVFLIIFVALLSLSSFVLIKRKSQFYQQVVNVKEEEYKYIETIFSIQQQNAQKESDHKTYYDHIERFTKALADSIGVNNVFKERVHILRDLPNYSEKALLKKYPSYNKADFEELKQIELFEYKKIAYIAFKAAQIHTIQPEKKELLFEANKASFNHREDALEVKIIAFSVFYALLRSDKIAMKKLTHDEIFDILSSQAFKRNVNDEIINIYLANKEEFETVIDKAYNKAVSG